MFNFNRKEKGQGLVEYALILALIAIVVIGALTALGTTVNSKFGAVNSELAGGLEGSCPDGQIFDAWVDPNDHSEGWYCTSG